MSFFRQVAAPALLTVLATVSFLGTGLHLLPGCGHFHGFGHYCAHRHAALDHGDYNEASEIGPSESDCPICRLLAIPRALAPPLQIADNGARIEPLAAATIVQPALEAQRKYAARAPPRELRNA